MMYYKGRIVKYGLDIILDSTGEAGISTVMAKKAHFKMPITEKECYEYLDYKRATQCLDVCKDGYACEDIKIDGNHYVRDIDRNAYISYTDLCHAMPSHIGLEAYGDAILKRALKENFIDRTKGVVITTLYCPVSFLAKHFVLTGCQEEYRDVFLKMVAILEQIPSAIRVDHEDDCMYIYPCNPYDFYRGVTKAQDPI